MHVLVCVHITIFIIPVSLNYAAPAIRSIGYAERQTVESAKNIFVGQKQFSISFFLIFPRENLNRE